MVFLKLKGEMVFLSPCAYIHMPFKMTSQAHFEYGVITAHPAIAKLTK